jgi:hypothetical protein
MFTPEFVSPAHGEFVLVANHNLGSEMAVRLSIDYNRARIAFGRGQVPDSYLPSDLRHSRAERLIGGRGPSSDRACAGVHLGVSTLMGVQLIVEASASEIEAALGDISAECELFPIAPGRYGLSVPMKIVDSCGEEQLRGRLLQLKYFDLWEGQWRGSRKWKLW